MSRGTAIPETMTLYVPFGVVKCGGRKEIQLPEGAPQPRTIDNTLVKALARAFRWKRMFETGEFPTIGDLANREEIAPSYMTRVLRLTLLASHIVGAIQDERQGQRRRRRGCWSRFQRSGSGSGGRLNRVRTHRLVWSRDSVFRLADRGYDDDWFREALKDKGIRACIPGRKSGKTVRYDKRRDKRRNRIEVMFGRLKD